MLPGARAQVHLCRLGGEVFSFTAPIAQGVISFLGEEPLAVNSGDPTNKMSQCGVICWSSSCYSQLSEPCALAKGFVLKPKVIVSPLPLVLASFFPALSLLILLLFIYPARSRCFQCTSHSASFFYPLSLQLPLLSSLALHSAFHLSLFERRIEISGPGARKPK